MTASRMHNEEAIEARLAAGIVVAAGSGSRLGGQVPKQFQLLAGKPVLLWSVEAMLRCNKFAEVIVVAPAALVEETRALMPANQPVRIVAGSPSSRTESVRNGLAALTGKPPRYVLIHDAARPGLSQEVLDELLNEDARCLEQNDWRHQKIRIHCQRQILFDVGRTGVENFLL